MKIAIVTETYPPEINGVAMSIARMVSGLLDRGHRIQLLRPRQSRADTAARTDNYSEQLLRGARIPRYPELKMGLPCTRRLRRLWSVSRPDLVHVATEGPLGWSAVTAARQLEIPVSSDLHTNFDNYSTHYGLSWLEGPVASYLRHFHNRTALTLVPTQAQVRVLREDGYCNVDVLGRGVDALHYSPSRRTSQLRCQWGLERHSLAVVYVGRLAAEKNLPLLVRAFEAVQSVRPDAKLVLVGDGPAREQLARQHPDYVFCGMRSGEDLAAHYASGDLFLFPSLSETFGNVTLEAMASGLPVVAYDYAAAAAVITHDENGLLAAPGDEDGFIEQARLLAGNIPKRLRLAVAARHQAQRLDWDSISDRFAQMLEEVIADAGKESQPPLSCPRELLV